MIIDGLIPYHIDNEELSSIIASTVIFNELKLLGYPKRKLSEIIEKPQYGYTASASQDPIGIKIVRITDIQSGKVNWDSVPYCKCEKPDNYLLKENDILFARTGGTTGKSFIVKGVVPESIFASYLIRVRPKNGINPDFLYWFFQTKQYWSQIITEKMGSAQPNVNGQKLTTLEIYIPDLSIQNSIAEFLIAYKRKISNVSIETPNLPKILHNASGKVAILEGLITKIEQVRQQHAKTKSQVEALLLSTLHKFFVIKSHDWICLPLNEIIAVTDKQVDPTLPEYSELPHISGENIESNTCRLLPYNTAMEDSIRSSNYLFSPGCVLYSKIRPYLQKCTYVDFQGVCSADIYPIRIIKDDIDPHFLKWTLVAEPFTEYANRLSGRTRMPKLNRKQLFNFEFSYPPLPEQRRIVAHLDRLQAKVDEVKRLQAETEREMEALVPAVLAKAFN